MSGFDHDAVSLALDDVAAWQTMLAGALAETGGALTDEERAWADRVLSAPRPEASDPAE